MTTFDEFQAIPEGEVFRVITTRYQQVVPGQTLTFACKKGHGYHDWCIYYRPFPCSVEDILRDGEKVTMKDNIVDLFPCDEEVLSRYRY